MSALHTWDPDVGRERDTGRNDLSGSSINSVIWLFTWRFTNLDASSIGRSECLLKHFVPK